MYKKQMVFQKIACLFSVVAAALTFVYSLGMITDIYDSLYATMMNPSDLTQTMVPGSIIYYDMQGFNKSLLYLSIGLILLACLLYLTKTHVRRRYYVGNFLSSGLFSAAILGVNVWAALNIGAFKTQYLTTVDFEALKAFSEMFKKPYIESTLLLDLHGLVLAVAVIAAGLLIANLVWKCRMMAGEQKLLNEREEAAL